MDAYPPVRSSAVSESTGLDSARDGISISSTSEEGNKTHNRTLQRKGILRIGRRSRSGRQDFQPGSLEPQKQCESVTLLATVRCQDIRLSYSTLKPSASRPNSTGTSYRKFSQAFEAIYFYARASWKISYFGSRGFYRSLGAATHYARGNPGTYFFSTGAVYISVLRQRVEHQ